MCGNLSVTEEHRTKMEGSGLSDGNPRDLRIYPLYLRSDSKSFSPFNSGSLSTVQVLVCSLVGPMGPPV